MSRRGDVGDVGDVRCPDELKCTYPSFQTVTIYLFAYSVSMAGMEGYMFFPFLTNKRSQRPMEYSSSAQSITNVSPLLDFAFHAFYLLFPLRN